MASAQVAPAGIGGSALNDDDKTPELELAEELASFDEALRGGKATPHDGDGEGGVEDCLRLLEECWPRHPNNAPTLVRSVLAAANAKTTVAQAPPTSVGRFQIRRELGRGGFGIVYLAHDPKLNREVALKVPRSDVVNTPELRQRFQQEARAAAGLDHQNLVPVYETGEDGPQCWIVSAYCPGANLADWLHHRAEPVLPTDAAQLVIDLCEGVQHAHDRGILHRDLKPANVLLVEGGGCATLPSTLHSPLSTPKITDFGLAKLADGMQTTTGTGMGTPAYMAPEQASGRAAPVAATVDVYSLGVILYELLTGRTPFTGDSPIDLLLQVRTEEPIAPSRLRPRLARDLETICLKCLEKEPSRRYPSARALSDDLQRYLKHEPIKARPVGAIGRTVRWTRRRPAVAALLVSLALTLTAGVAGITWQWWRAENNADQAGRDRDVAKRARDKEVEALDRHRILHALDEWYGDNVQSARDLLRDAGARKDTWEYRYVDRLCNLGLHDFGDHKARVRGAVFTQDARKLISAGADGTMIVHDLAAGTAESFAVPPDRRAEISTFSLNPVDGRTLAVLTIGGEVVIWDLREKKVVDTWKANGFNYYQVIAYSPKGRYLVTTIGHTARVWDTATKKLVANFHHGGSISDIDWSADERYLGCAANGPRQVRIWNVESGEERIIPTLLWMATAVAFSPDGKRFAWAGMDGVVAIHDVTADFKQIGTLSGSYGYQACLSFSPDGQLVVAGGLNGPLRMWRVETGQLVWTLHGHSSGVRFASFSPDGSMLATVGADRHVIVWDSLDYQDVLTAIDMSRFRLRTAAFSSDGKQMISVANHFRRWDLDHRTARFTFPDADAVSAAFHPSGQEFAGGDEQGSVYVFDKNNTQLAFRRDSGYALALKYADEGRRILVAGWNNAVCSWDPSGPGEPEVIVGPLGRVDRRGLGAGACLATFSPAGDTFAYMERGQAPEVWDLRERKKLVTLKGTPPGVTAMALGRTGERLAIGSFDGEIQVRDARSGALVSELRGHPTPITGLAFTPDGTRLASVAGDGVIKLWDPAAGVEVLSLRGHATFDTNIAFSPDGEQLVAGGWDGFLRIWSLRDRRLETETNRRERVRSWHEWHANDARETGRWFVGRQHLDHLIDAEHQDWDLFRRRGDARAALGDWAGAAADYDAAIARPDCDPIPYFMRAYLFLRSADDAGYWRVVKQMADHFGKEQSQVALNGVAWFGAIRAKPEIPPAELVRLAQDAFDAANLPADRHEALGTLGAALYRADRLDEAIKRLDECEATRGITQNWLFLAMAHHRKGAGTKAKEYFDRAVAEIAKVYAGGTLSDGQPMTWWLRLELNLLYEEAKAMLAER